MKNAILFAENQEYVSQKCEKSYFSTIYRISAQNRIRPWSTRVCIRDEHVALVTRATVTDGDMDSIHSQDEQQCNLFIVTPNTTTRPLLQTFELHS